MKASWFTWMLLLLPMYVSAQVYTAINLPASMGTGFYVTGINPGGSEIVGAYYDGVKDDGVRISGSGTAFVKISYPSLGTLTDTFSCSAAGVNDYENVVGACNPVTNTPVSPEYGMTYYKNGGYSIYEASGPKMTWFNGINNKGAVVGTYQDWGCDVSTCNRRGFQLINGVISTLEFPGALATYALGINNPGEIVGYYEDSARNVHGYTWKPNNTYQEFTTISGATLAGINDSGDIVGSYPDLPHGFLVSSSGAVYAILYPGSTNTSVTGVANRLGDTVKVVGNYTDSGGKAHGFYAVVTLP